MKELYDTALLEELMTKHQLLSLFDTPNLAFRLYQYEKGELINHLNSPSEYLLFMVSGVIQINALRKDGSIYSICCVDSFTCLGDMEFIDDVDLNFYVEVQETTLCLALPLYAYKTQLLNDNVFLRFLLQSVTQKMAQFSSSAASFSSLEEKLLHYMAHECPNQQIQGVELTALQLRCSRRQLQRLLKSLTEQGIITHPKKGVYQLL